MIDLFYACDMCEADAADWPTGLALVDREIGMFTGDFTTCPVCAPKSLGPDGLVKFLRDGIAFAYINWYWWDADTKTSTAYLPHEGTDHD